MGPKRAVVYKSQYYIHNHQDGCTKKEKVQTKATASKKSNADLGWDLDVCQCDKTGSEASSSSESGSSSDTDLTIDSSINVL